jgi:hypothetical protein
MYYIYSGAYHPAGKGLPVMFWSKNKSTVAISAGSTANHLAQTGRSINGISHGRPDVVPKTSGMERLGSPAAVEPRERRAQRASKAADTTPMLGAKLESVFRTVLLKNTDLRKPLSDRATVKVVVAQTKVRRAFVNVDAGEAKVRPTSDTASTTNIVLIRVEKISSVNLVKYWSKSQ